MPELHLQISRLEVVQQQRYTLLKPEVAMRSFVSACIVASVIAVAAAAVLDLTVQESAASAFSTSAVRLSK